MKRGYRPRRKQCAFCQDKSKIIDYKDIKTLQRYVSDRGKILPRRSTGNCAKHQRKVTEEIKKARQVILLPYSAD